MSESGEVGEGATPLSRPASTMPSPPKPPPSEHQRHWPLDLASGLPFDRYEHRRLTARDILVNRIISKVLFPTPDLSRALDDRRRQKSSPKLIETCCSYHMRESQNKTMAHHNFGPIRQHDRGLARDIEVLRKMLVTGSDAEWLAQSLTKPVHLKPPTRSESENGYRTQPSLVITTCQPPEDSAAPTVEEEVLDLVRRYYMETDDACTRLWLQSIQPVQRSTYNTLPKQPAKRNSYKHLAQLRRRWDERNKADDHKRWYDDDTAHLKALQIHAHVASDNQLYEGGAVLPHLRRALFPSKVAREMFLDSTTLFSRTAFFTEENDALAVMRDTYPWPEPAAPRRVMHLPSWYSWRQRYDFWMSHNPHSVPAFEFASSRTGRGLDRDGIWSTARWHGDDLSRGRTARRGRRRATSEPPHGLFTAARLPASFNSTREILLFPKMSLAAIDRRARRRSLSRTRIAEMFNWDAVFEAPPPYDPSEMVRVSKQSSDANSFPFDSSLQLSEIDTMYGRPALLYKDIVSKFKKGRISIAAVKIFAWAGAPTSEPRVTPWPRWWLDIEKLTGESLNNKHVSTDPQPVVDSLWDAAQPSSLSSLEETKSPSTPVKPVPCVNCTSIEHTTDRCIWPCGYCGAVNPNVQYSGVSEARFKGIWKQDVDCEDDGQPSEAGKHGNPHLAPNCPVAKQNRCKCVPFPQFHVAAKCPIVCSRDCGNHEHPPGHFKHKNAMGCKARCCMCGIKGHSGMKCKWRRCRCGGEHLGQDCGWHPECRVKGCDRFLCGVHCQVCGVNRAQLEEGVGLVGRQCPTCAGVDDTLASARMLINNSGQLSCEEAVQTKPQDHQSNSAGQKRRRRSNKRKHRSDAPKSPPEEKPWYAPLEPRTRPVASGKSGKRRTWDRADADLPVKIGGCR